MISLVSLALGDYLENILTKVSIFKNSIRCFIFARVLLINVRLLNIGTIEVSRHCSVVLIYQSTGGRLFGATHKRNECPRQNWDWSSYWFQCSKPTHRCRDQHRNDGKSRPLFVRAFRRWINDEHECSSTGRNVAIWEFGGATSSTNHDPTNAGNTEQIPPPFGTSANNRGSTGGLFGGGDTGTCKTKSTIQIRI